MAHTRTGQHNDNCVPNEPTVAYNVTVTGRVQGVGFRAWTQWTARRLGVYGWVKNDDWTGDVIVYTEGSESTVNAFLETLETGPSMSRVAAVRAEKTTPRGYAGFEVEY